MVVGAGPTGVEFTSELRDWVESEGRRYYGKLLKYVKITLVEAGDAVLAVFDKQLQEEAMRRLTGASPRTCLHSAICLGVQLQIFCCCR